MKNAPVEIDTSRLKLTLESPETSQERIAALPPEVVAELSPTWLAQVRAAKESDPWLHGYAIALRSGSDSEPVGSIGFKGPPDAAGVVEVAYGIDEGHQGKGYATEALDGAVQFALGVPEVCLVRAHTLPEENASTAVLKKCQFQFLGEVMDPEDGQVWRWERGHETSS